MKTYLAKFCIWEGEHTYDGAFLLAAASEEEALALAKSQEHEPLIPDDDAGELAYWDFGDGTTAAHVEHVIEVTEEEANILRRLRLAYDL